MKRHTLESDTAALPLWKSELKQMDRQSGQCCCSLLCDNCNHNAPKHQQDESISFCHVEKYDLFLAKNQRVLGSGQTCPSDLRLLYTECSVSDFLTAVLLCAKLLMVVYVDIS